jgi:hypothetical protein
LKASGLTGRKTSSRPDKLDKGYFTLPGKPGLGVEVSEKILETNVVDGMEPFEASEPPWVVSGTFKDHKH